ncbi:uncharacterized protein SPAPADRAFT_135304 [Spathaspora passalidarum NRRL Y-27907]|uniref:TOG domain-containing protein n=1 Tax=Spathaspora passalidarum (strain NRRL Y-27907 / 11-Y1) TaxID=619300 RepID=G3AIU3_SPAPN|nr:uncharacterized protein SPAPADRAFT_135304 [Spathaspora passalidarum NRRL Y-27907]EGW33754.1 hypothetical protein SPAPADRAFT_135304 [Spathaspora passalidarum NRRL Y-27907]
MAEEEQDYSAIPLDERLVHKVWKARLHAYTEIVGTYETSRNEQDPCFNVSSDLFKKAIMDANVVAQEQGYNALVKYLTFGGTPANFNRIKSGLIGPICEKGLNSSRKNTKEYAQEVLLLMIEITDQPDTIIEEIIPYFGNRLPKTVAGCVSALAAIYENFGCQIVSPKPVIPCLVKLFAHSDKNVRAETMKLTVELYKWMRDALSATLLPSLKPVQQKDLTAAFEAVSGVAPEQKRLTRSQKQQLERENEQQAIGDDQDVDMEENNQPVDPLAFIDPVEVLSKFPANFEARISSSAWKERVEVLDEIVPILQRVVKLVPDDDYTAVMRLFAKCILKDANIQVVQLSANCTEMIAKGLGSNFQKYQSLVLSPLIERSKEKKPSVAQALDNALDAIFMVSGGDVGSILEAAINGMKLKTPQNKISAANFVKRCLSSTTVAPISSEIDAIMEIGIKLLSESQAPIRQAATEMIGTLMKITGERELNSFLTKVEEHRKAQIIAYFETAEVKCKLKSAPAPAVQTSSTTQRSNGGFPKKTLQASNGIGAATKLGARTSLPHSSIPAKRMATSPAKRSEEVKASNFGRGLTSRPITNSNVRSRAPGGGIAAGASVSASTDDSRYQNEIAELKNQIKDYQHQQSQQESRIKSLQTENSRLQQDLQNVVLQLENEKRNIEIASSVNETNINKVRSELKKSHDRIIQLERQLDLERIQSTKHQPYLSESTRSPLRPSTIIESNELSAGVKRLSIEGDIAMRGSMSPSFQYSGSTSSYSPITPANLPSHDTRNIEDDWKRAAEVTSQLRARIEKMKARSRNSTMNST